MATHRSDQWVTIRCPFFQSDNGDSRSLRCEGYTEGGMAIVSCFRTLKQRERHLDMYCTSQYEKCPVYKMVYDEKYKE